MIFFQLVVPIAICVGLGLTLGDVNFWYFAGFFGANYYWATHPKEVSE